MAVSLVGAWFLFSPKAVDFGQASGLGNLLAEHYIPYISTNGGFNTNLPMLNGGGEQIGTNGTNVQRLDTGMCYIQAYATTIAASSTGIVDCQATKAVGGVTTANDVALVGVSPGDNVVVELATSSQSTTYGGINVDAASASTTPGFIQLYIVNSTGTTYTWPTTGSATGTVSYVVTH